MPVRNIGEGSDHVERRYPLPGPYGLTAGKDRHLTTDDSASHGSLYLPGLKTGVSRGKSDERHDT